MKFISKTILFSALLLLIGFISFAQVKPKPPLNTSIKPAVPLKMFDPQVHVYLGGSDIDGISKDPIYFNGYAKIGRFFKEGVYNRKHENSEGYIDKKGRIIISPNNLELGEFSEGLVSVCNKLSNGEYKLGFMDITGKVVIPLIYKCGNDNLFSEGLCAVENSNGKVGFINKFGKIVLPFKYSMVHKDFENGIAEVWLTATSDAPTVINKQGKIVSERESYSLINGTNKTTSNSAAKRLIEGGGSVSNANSSDALELTDWLEGKRFKSNKNGLIVQYGYISSLNTSGFTFINSFGDKFYYMNCSKEISADQSLGVFTQCINPAGGGEIGVIKVYKTGKKINIGDSSGQFTYNLIE